MSAPTGEPAAGVPADTEPTDDTTTAEAPALTGTATSTVSSRASGDDAATDRRSRRTRAVRVGVAAVLVLGGATLWLTRPRMLDTDDVAHTISERMSRQVGETVTVSCPTQAHKTAGETFRCSVTDATGVRRTVVVTVTDDHGKFTWRTTN